LRIFSDGTARFVLEFTNATARARSRGVGTGAGWYLVSVS
jgi:hypothetical protein